jgi:hypothetical protein
MSLSPLLRLLTSSAPSIARCAAARRPCPHAPIMVVVCAASLSKQILHAPLAALVSLEHTHSASGAPTAPKGTPKCLWILPKQARKDVCCPGRVHPAVAAAPWASEVEVLCAAGHAAGHAVRAGWGAGRGCTALQAFLPVHIVDLGMQGGGESEVKLAIAVM